MDAIEQLKSVLCDPEGKCCIAGSDEDRAIIDRALQALAQRTEQEPVALDLSQVNRLTHFKTNGIIDAHKYNITGFVLTNDDGKKCISDMAAVRWFDNKDFFGMMHNEPAYPPQRTEQNFCSRCGKRTADLTHIHTCTPPKENT